MKKKTVKEYKKNVWTLIHVEMTKPENEAYFAGGDCCCSPEPESLAVYEKKSEAERNAKYHTNYRVVKAQLVYKI